MHKVHNVNECLLAHLFSSETNFLFVRIVILYLQGLVFYFTPGVRPSKSVLVGIVAANGGHVVDSLYQLNSKVK